MKTYHRSYEASKVLLKNISIHLTASEAGRRVAASLAWGLEARRRLERASCGEKR
jgi:hypothetical protein